MTQLIPPPNPTVSIPSTHIPRDMLTAGSYNGIGTVRLNISVYAKLQYLATMVTRPMLAIGTYISAPNVVIDRIILPHQELGGWNGHKMTPPVPNLSDLDDIRNYAPNTINFLIVSSRIDPSNLDGDWIIVHRIPHRHRRPTSCSDFDIEGFCFDSVNETNHKPFNVRVAWTIPYYGANPDAWSIEYSDAISPRDTALASPHPTPVGGPLTPDELAELKWLASQEKPDWQRYVT
jgi:hypothetical protein